MLEVEELSATRLVGEAVIVDSVADTGPAVNVAATVFDNVMVSVVSVAEMVLVSALVDFIVPVACPLALVADAG